MTEKKREMVRKAINEIGEQTFTAKQISEKIWEMGGAWGEEVTPTQVARYLTYMDDIGYAHHHRENGQTRKVYRVVTQN